ncbi:YihY/virulence factor BrkB family protein [Streptococcus sp. Marseille-Q5619]|uniref:YihY/virulence factor BrkB family protein n=1 Tax=Streptococcus sp. Marseille-Q5619 TaxID=2972780 RepID=UPI0021CAB77F|nr:YihY/virulence factor BrkB family protein [Streptococcus sp. Marseille-Q5619]
MKKWWKELIDRPLVKAFLHYYQASDSELTSVAVAYYWLISIFPLLLVVVNTLPYFQIPVSNFLKVVNEFLPESMYDVVAKIITEVLTQPSTGLLSFAVLSALWTFSKSMNFLQKAFNKAYGVEKSRGLISHQMVSLLVSFGLQLLFAFALFLSLFGQMILDLLAHYWTKDGIIYQALQGLAGPLTYALLFAILVMLYYFLPNLSDRKISYTLPGSAFVLLVILGLLTLFSSYLNYYVHHLVDVRILGSVLLVVMMFWFILIAKIVILGAVINASIQSLKDPSFRKD